MKKIFTLCLLSHISYFISHISLAQTVKVIDKSTLQSLQFVTISSGPTGVTTNAKGKADISIFKDADSIQFSFLGYQTLILNYRQIEEMKFKIALPEKTFSLGEVVVSASRFEEKKEDVAQQIQVMKSRDLKFMNQQTTADIIQQSGNVLVQKSQQGGGSPVIRGFEANKILIVVDGVRMNNAIYRGGHLQNILMLDNAILEKTEIVFGPGSVVYGSDALGGVMHFYTRNPQLSDDSGKINFDANAFSRFSSANNEKTAHADFSFGLKKLVSLTSFTYSDFDDLRSGRKPDDVYDKIFKRKFYVENINGKDSIFVNEKTELQKSSGYSQYDFLEKILFRQSENISHILNLQFSNSSDIPRYDRLTEISGTKPKFAEWYYGPQKRIFGSYSLNLKTEKSFYDNGKFILAYQNLEEIRHDRKFNKIIRSNRMEKLDVLTLNADFDKLIKKNEIRYGIEAARNRVNSSAFSENILTGEKSSLDTRYPDGGSTMQTTAIYLTHTLEISEKFILNDGIRFSYVMLNSKFNDTTFFPFPFSEVTQKNKALNGNLGLIFMPTKSWRFSALVSTGFRAPNVDDLSKIFESAAGNIIVPNPELKPEKTYNAEISVLKNFKDVLQIEAVGFFTIYKNAITSGNATFNGQDSIFYNGVLSQITTSVNKNEAYIYGTSWNFSADITENFSVTSSLNYTYGRIKTDTVDYPLDHIPPVFGKAGFQLRLNKFRSEFFILYNGEKKLDDYNMFGEDNFVFATPEGMPAWHTLNLRIAYQFTKNIQLQLACENILDTHYRVFASGISGAGRNFMVTLRANI